MSTRRQHNSTSLAMHASTIQLTCSQVFPNPTSFILPRVLSYRFTKVAANDAVSRSASAVGQSFKRKLVTTLRWSSSASVAGELPSFETSDAWLEKAQPGGATK